MGWGDELIASGQAKLAQRADSRKVRIVGADGLPRWHAAWLNNPRIAAPGESGAQRLVNGPSARPYIERKTSRCWHWKEFRPEPGELYFDESERCFASSVPKPWIVVEPLLKASASPNKQWGWERWCEFARLAQMEGLRLTQLGPPGIARLPNSAWIETSSYRTGCAVLARAVAYVGHEGGLHHAAAALGVRGVVIYGGFISPAQTGYDLHRNLFTGGDPCGMRMTCRHCERAMAAIEPAQVLHELRGILEATPGHLAS